MTLNTAIYILDPVSPLEVISFCNRELLGVQNPPHTFELLTYSFNTVRYGNVGGLGYSADFNSKYTLDNSYLLDDDVREYNDEEDVEECTYFSPRCFMELSFDTGYGYRGPEGYASDLHEQYIRELHKWLSDRGARLKWKNEFTGEVFEGIDGFPF